MPMFFFGANAQIAQNGDFGARADRAAQVTEEVCTELSHNLYLGVRDRNTDGEVTELKNFLRTEGYINGNRSGVFNLPTFYAVMEFQSENNILASGFVGPQTRAAIEAESCDDDDDNENDELSIERIDGPTALMTDEEGTWTVNVSGDNLGDIEYKVKWGDEGWSPLRLFSSDDDETQASATFTHTYTDEGTYTPEFTVIDEDGNEVTKDAASVDVSDEADEDRLAIDSIDPSSGPVGTEVTLEGEGFDGRLTVHLSGTPAENIDVDDDTYLTFTVPELEEGDYRVVVRSDEGRSNAVKFTVTEDAEPEGKVSISGISAPTSLEEGEEGSWTVNADTNLSGNLQYSVDWGDEPTTMARLMGSAEADFQSSATFTHTYQEAGTYHPKFTVKDEEGNTASVSASVVVSEQDDDDEND